MSQAVANHRGRKKRGWGRRERWERKKKRGWEGSGNLLSLVLICGTTRMGDNGGGEEHRRREVTTLPEGAGMQRGEREEKEK